MYENNTWFILTCYCLLPGNTPPGISTFFFLGGLFPTPQARKLQESNTIAKPDVLTKTFKHVLYSLLKQE